MTLEEDLPVSTLPPVGRRYVWRARACNLAGCSGYSTPRYLDVGRDPADVDGDGDVDLIVGAPIEAMGGAQTGAVHEFRSPDFSMAARIHRPASGRTFYGSSLSFAGDIDGDGFGDLVAGNQTTAGETPYLRILRGQPGGLEPGPTLVIPSEIVSEDEFGVLGAGADLDGDGYSDVVVGAPRQDRAGAVDSGRVYVFWGGSSGLGATPTILDTPNPATQGTFGFALASQGDVDGDGFVDLLASAPGEAGATMPNSGRVYLFRGTSDRAELAARSQVIVSANAQAGGSLGVRVSLRGDFNSDGLADAVVSSIEDVGIALRAGRVYVHYGSPDGLRSAASVVISSPSPTGVPLGRAGSFGTSFVVADFTGDGRSDLAVGAATDGTAGMAYLFANSATGLTSTPVEIPCPVAGFTAYGFAIQRVAGTSVDGSTDIAVGSPGIDSVFVFDSTGRLSSTITGPAGSSFGNFLADG